MLVDGNDERGIDVGIMTREGFPVIKLCSHVDNRLPNGFPVFARDCPEYMVTTPMGNKVIVMVNHFKSKGYGGQAASDARRKAQAERVEAIYQGLIAEGVGTCRRYWRSQ